MKQLVFSSLYKFGWTYRQMNMAWLTCVVVAVGVTVGVMAASDQGKTIKHDTDTISVCGRDGCQ